MTSRTADATAAVTGAPAPPRRTALQRAMQVIRIHLVAWQGMIGWPFGILGSAFLVNLAIFSVVDAPPEGRTTAALISIYIVMGIGYLEIMTQYFPLALGLSVTRRAFYAGTTLFATAQAVLFGAALLALKGLEQATGGWGLQLKFFAPPGVAQDSVIAQWLVYTVPFLTVGAVGMAIGVVFKRWGQTGLFVTTIATAALLTGAVLLVSWQNWWRAVGSFLTEQPTLALWAGYPLLLAVVLGGAGYLALRRTTP